ncbi:hypothetical protein KC19_VG119000 [Ceratodon purpureus]|uniref:Uncharacterized protein n=1 Tax=Ceratodon purpureus TaxID=3225 RepID=A0A8T0HPE7_CERPU|nr:hypothetical protein KC19_VG119000 [Ceratodon purpureus]
MRSYFQCIHRHGFNQPLALDLDGSHGMLLGLKELSKSGDQSFDPAAERAVSFDTTITPYSLSGSKDTVVISCKSLCIIVSSIFEDLRNAKLGEIREESEGEEDEVNSSLRKEKLRSSKSKVQKRYDSHRKSQTIWAITLPWAKPILASDRIFIL